MYVTLDGFTNDRILKALSTISVRVFWERCNRIVEAMYEFGLASPDYLMSDSMRKKKKKKGIEHTALIDERSRKAMCQRTMASSSPYVSLRSRKRQLAKKVILPTFCREGGSRLLSKWRDMGTIVEEVAYLPGDPTS